MGAIIGQSRFCSDLARHQASACRYDRPGETAQGDGRPHSDSRFRRGGAFRRGRAGFSRRAFADRAGLWIDGDIARDYRRAIAGQSRRLGGKTNSRRRSSHRFRRRDRDARTPRDVGLLEQARGDPRGIYR